MSIDIVREWLFNYGERLDTALKILICASVFIFMLKYGAGRTLDRYEESRKNIMDELHDRMNKSSKSMFNYKYQQSRLDKLGVSYRTNYKVTPVEYMVIRFILALGLMIVSATINPLLSVVGAIVGFVLPDIIINEINKQDNNNMTEDLIDVYSCILLQASSGGHLSDLIVDSFLIVKNKRLEKALLELAGAMKSNKTILVALDVFNNKFDCEAINNFTICLKQMSEVGSFEAQMDNARKHLGILRDQYYKRKISDRKTISVVVAVLLLGGIVAMIMYLGTLGVFSDIEELFW